MTLDQIDASFPPPFYTMPSGFATTPEMIYFQCGMMVNLANEIRALRLAIENFHKTNKVEVTPNDQTGSTAPPDQGGQ